jgi:hypothetical protein
VANEYALGQLARALTTAVTSENQTTRDRADRRAEAWMRAIDATARGEVRVGARTPVVGLPEWVTLEVLRGGFATGSAVAEGPLEPDELALAERLGIEPNRRVLFSYFVTDEGLDELWDLLDRGTYQVVIPEDAALLVMAWLGRQGERAAAFELLDALDPLAGRLHLIPRRASTGSVSRLDHVFRSSVAESSRQLADRREHTQVEAQREALAVWNPFADSMLEFWFPRCEGDRIDFDVDEEWRHRAVQLLREYQRLADSHPRCTKHRRPKENLAILLSSTRQIVSGQELDARGAGLLAAAIRSMVAKRGVPGSATLAAIRDEQAGIIAQPAHAALAKVAASRLSTLDPQLGISEPHAYVHSVTEAEGEAAGIPSGTAMPPAVTRILARSRSAPIEVLIDSGVVPSAEVLSALVPAISAEVVSRSYSDAALSHVLAANYRAFRARRSLLLLNLEKQVQLEELPWVRSTQAYRVDAADAALSVARRVGALALGHFPATILPNPLLRELDHLLREGGLDVPLTEELAADIFMGRFSPKFARAALRAGDLLVGSVYARYYDMDLSTLRDPAPHTRRLWRKNPTPESDGFAALCQARAGVKADKMWSVARKGMLIEQAQILTTHNLAALVSVGAGPRKSWLVLADEAVDTVVKLLALANRQHRPLATIKDAAYAWRQTIFFLSMAPAGAAEPWIRATRDRHATGVMDALLGGLADIADGGQFDSAGRSAHGRRLLGWTIEPHWVLRQTRSGITG